ncbi:MAG: HEAT repeat domain-containing protein [Planctomycetota bacterium]
MRPRTVLALTLALVAAGGVLARRSPAQSAPAQSAETGDELFEDLLLEGGERGDFAAAKLFTSQLQPERLRQIMGDRENPKARLCILRALKLVGHQRPSEAFELTQAGLGDTDAAIHDAAVRALGFIEAPYTYQAIGKELHELRYARPETGAGRRARGLVAGIERLRYPMRATGVLIAALAERMEPSLEQQVRLALERITAQRFSSPAQWQTWWKEIRDRQLTPSEWRHEVGMRRWEAQRQIERTAEELYGRLLGALADKPPRLLQELERGLAEERVPGICQRAIFELGRLGRLTEDTKAAPEREQAVKLLVARLTQGNGADYDPTKAEVIRALGQTGDRSLLPDLRRFLHHDAPRMRVAAVNALAELGSAEAVGPLLEQLDHEDGDLVRAALMALGRIGVDAVVAPGPPPVHVSDRLVAFCRRQMQQSGGGDASHIAAAARALGALCRGRPSPAVVDLLTQLVPNPGTNVRFEAVSALGYLPDARAFAVLNARLPDEPEVHLKKEILGSLGRQAQSSVAFVGSAVKTLSPYLFTTREQEAALRQVSHDSLMSLARGDDLVGLSAIVGEVLAQPDPNAKTVALDFLGAKDALPEPGSERVGKLDAAARARYYDLLAKRAGLRLEAEPAKALEDYSTVLAGRGLHTVDAIDDASLPIFLGKARALLLVPERRPREAFGIAEACLKHRADAETWSVTLSALAELRLRSPAELPPLLERLEPKVQKAPPEVRERFAALKRPPEKESK